MENSMENKLIKNIIGGIVALEVIRSGIKLLQPKQKPSEKKIVNKYGCVVRCSLYKGIDHTGILVDDNKIVEISADGIIELVDYNKFLEDTLSQKIYVATDKETGEILGSESIKQFALEKVNEKFKYNLLINNCHNFSYSCLMQKINTEFFNKIKTFEMLCKNIQNILNKGEPIEWKLIYEKENV
jgi:hypothetical protein